jgi:hypothetical protein
MDTAAAPQSAAPAVYNATAGFIAALAGAALFSLVFWATSENGPMPVHWPEWTSNPVHLTPLFALPLGLFWMANGRLKAPGLVFFLVGMTAAHWLAMTETISVAQSARTDHLEGVIAGATGGAIGSVGTWLVLMLMGPAFRTPKAAAVMAVAAVLLIAIGAYGIGVGSLSNLMALLTGKPFQGPELEPGSLVLALYLPWQAVYGAALVNLFRAHRAA